MKVLVDLGVDCKKAENRRQFTTRDVHKKGRKGSFFKTLHELAIQRLELDPTISVATVRLAYHRALNKFEAPQVLTEYDRYIDSNEDLVDQKLIHSWQIGHFLNSLKLFDACCAFCGALL